MAAIPATSPQTSAAIQVPEVLIPPLPADEMPDAEETLGDATAAVAAAVAPTIPAEGMLAVDIVTTIDEAGTTGGKIGVGETEGAAAWLTTKPVSIVASIIALDGSVVLFM